MSEALEPPKTQVSGRPNDLFNPKQEKGVLCLLLHRYCPYTPLWSEACFGTKKSSAIIECLNDERNNDMELLQKKLGAYIEACRKNLCGKSEAMFMEDIVVPLRRGTPQRAKKTASSSSVNELDPKVNFMNSISKTTSTSHGQLIDCKNIINRRSFRVSCL